MRKILQFFILISFLILSNFLCSQKTICYGDPTNNSKIYNVDLTDGPSGTVGSVYNWTISAGFLGSFSGDGTNKYTVNWGSTPPGTYTLTVIETNNGCVGNPKMLTVTINPKPTVTVNSPTICQGDVKTITATQGTPGTYTYTWTVPTGAANPGNVSSFTPTISGTYSIVITDPATGCSSNSASGTVTINPKLITSAIGF